MFGCGNSSDNIQSYLDEVNDRPAISVDELPDLGLSEPYAYGGSDLRIPFLVPQKKEPQYKIEDSAYPKKERPKEPLEHYALDALRMVGTIEKNRQKWAIIINAEGLIYRATTGSHLGKNNGEVVSVSDQRLRLLETIPDERGGWFEREAFLELNKR